MKFAGNGICTHLRLKGKISVTTWSKELDKIPLLSLDLLSAKQRNIYSTVAKVKLKAPAMIYVFTVQTADTIVH